MTNNQFNLILKNRLESISDVLEKKAEQYAHGDDCLHTFRAAARVNNTSVKKALWGMATKHLVSTMDLVSGDLKNTQQVVSEKLGDLINYLILLEAALWEER